MAQSTMRRVRDKLEIILDRLTNRADERVFLKLYSEPARAAAEAADARSALGINLGPLDGKIVSIKDLVDVAGETTTAGSAILRDAAPAAADALVVTRLRRAGSVIIGKTNMAEFAFNALGLNPHYGTPGNALDSQRIPGGSSSGSGVSVAEGTCEIAIGSDTGGSIRIPAALNGVVGFKPTFGRVPTDGVFPLSFSLDSIGPLARTVADCAAADAVLANEDSTSAVPIPLSGVRLGVPRGLLVDGVEPMVSTSYEACLALLETVGVHLLDFAIDDLVQAMQQATKFGTIASFEGAAVHADRLRVNAAAFDQKNSRTFLRRLEAPAHQYIQMMQRRAELMRDMDRRLMQVDAFALPTTPITAPLIAPLLADPELAERTEMQLLRYTYIANQFGLTAITLPIPDIALPSGFMLLARGGSDRMLLEIAASVERVLQLRS